MDHFDTARRLPVKPTIFVKPMIRLIRKTPEAPLAVRVLVVPTIIGVISVVADPVPDGIRKNSPESSATTTELSFVYPFSEISVRFTWRRTVHLALAVLVLVLAVIALVYQYK